MGSWRVRPLTVVVLVVLLAVTGSGAWITHVIVRDQERRLLSERTSEVGLVLTTSLDQIAPSLSALDQVLRATGGSAPAFVTAATTEAQSSSPQVTYAWLKPSGTSWVTVAAAGPALRAGSVITGMQGRTLQAASAATVLVATPVIGAGANRLIGFALATSGVPGGGVLYRETLLGPVSAPRAAATSPFHEVRVVLYAAPRVDATQVLVATTADLPLGGSANYEPLAVGASHWLLAVAATQPLVGSVAASAQWFALAVGIAGSLLIGLVVEIEARRRSAALALYSGERVVAEALQRSLLPALPFLAGLDSAARYEAGGDHQQVGGDWFDVFEIEGDRIGLVIGDVIGHDTAAAAAMSQIRAALRAYAWEGAEPAAVLSRLDRLVGAFGLAQLITVFYGVLLPSQADGSRAFRYANAGHLYPLAKSPTGDVRLVTGGNSTVIGAPITEDRDQAEEILELGTVLLFYTDGLVEVPGTSIGDCINDLAVRFAAFAPGDSPDALCTQILASMPRRELHDDIAVLTVRTVDSAERPDRPSGSAIQAI